jgi:Bacterial transcriptional activator domain
MASATLRIRLLGGLDLRQGEVALPPLGSARAESLLALLRLHQEAAQPRQRLAFLLWPDSSEGQARTNLRHLLHVLRRALPEPDRFLEVTPRTLRWRPDAPCWLDMAAFDAALARSERDPGGAEAALSEAVELYAGDLLQGSYDEWLAEERERLRQRYLQALERLVELLEARGDLAAATGRAERLLREGRDVRVLEHRRRLDGLGERGAEIVTGDAVDPDDLRRLFEGAEAALVLLPEDLTDQEFVANRSRMSDAIADALAGSRSAMWSP